MLILIKVLHTAVWAVMASAIVSMPWLIVCRRWRWVLGLMLMVSVECLVVAVNGMRCPLTDVAARYTTDRAANFDIYLPEWLALYNKVIFGTFFVGDLMFAVVWRARDRR